MRLVAWKSHVTDVHSKVIAATCHRNNFGSLLRLLLSGSTLRHGDHLLNLLASEFRTRVLCSQQRPGQRE